MDFNVEQSGAVGVMTIGGELTVQHADELKAALMRSLDAVDHLILNLDKVTEIDLSCLQLLCSAHRTSTELKKQLTITGNQSDALKQVIETAGYSRHVGCAFDCNKSCLWLGGN
ncbi:MAG: STAS domain-containing protein [Nitrospirae bacterium]|nr:STAS domain-containing protein [Nitrospirota bacterium]MCL5237719.1 STAS domain-containing protein [Nitrospirota bacterium]